MAVSVQAADSGLTIRLIFSHESAMLRPSSTFPHVLRFWEMRSQGQFLRSIGRAGVLSAEDIDVLLRPASARCSTRWFNTHHVRGTPLLKEGPRTPAGKQQRLDLAAESRLDSLRTRVGACRGRPCWTRPAAAEGRHVRTSAPSRRPRNSAFRRARPAQTNSRDRSVLDDL